MSHVEKLIRNFFLLNAYMGSFERAQPALQYYSKRGGKTKLHPIKQRTNFSSSWRNKFLSNSINEGCRARAICREFFFHAVHLEISL